MRLIDADELKKKFQDKSYWTYTHEYGDAIPIDWIMSGIDNAPTVDTTCPHCDSGYAQGLSDGYLKGKEDRPQGEYVDISKLRLMTVEECAGHTIDYAMGWKACIEWIKKGGAE